MLKKLKKINFFVDKLGGFDYIAKNEDNLNSYFIFLTRGGGLSYLIAKEVERRREENTNLKNLTGEG